MEFSGCSLVEFYTKEDDSSGGMMGRERAEQDDSIYKSKNLHAERKRRQKLSDSLLALRSLVPTITNMTRASIIEDAITYIQELQENVKILSDQLFEMEATSEEAAKTMTDEMDATEEIKQSGIEEDVQVTSLDGNRMWIKIILEKKRGWFTRLLEAMSCLGLELIDTSVTTSRGAILVSSSVQGTYGDTLGVPETKELLLDIMRNI